MRLVGELEEEMNLGEKVASFSEDVVNTRHYYTHYNERYRDEAVTSDSEIVLLRHRMELLLSLLLLKNAGFTKKQLSNYSSKFIKFHNLLEF